jgi:formylglycine-generating enzyme required for sulfatase activity
MKALIMGILMTGVITFQVVSQDTVSSIILDPDRSLKLKSVVNRNGDTITFHEMVPMFSVVIDSTPVNSGSISFALNNDTIAFLLHDSVHCVLLKAGNHKAGCKYILRMTNLGCKAKRVENLVPLGEGSDRVYITAQGSRQWPGYLCRSKLYRPGFGPVGVILPDNTWHLGFADLRINQSVSITALARRIQRDKEKTDIDRWRVTIKPGGWTEYAIWIDLHQGDWHQGLKMMFQDRWLYDLPEFDTGMFARHDLKWMREKYIMLLQFAWDKKYFDFSSQRFTFFDHFLEYDSLTGGYDIFTLWPTWPRLGLDQRNQWDMYRDLPGGLDALRRQVDFVHSLGRKYFISYNPWDAGTRKEDQFTGMEELLRATDADGVVLDTKGESSRELQATADRVRPGIIMYSEGMAVPKDMPGIVSGRVHDALVLPPPVNLNKFIKPDFAIFRVLQLADDRLHRELAISFFNGYGVEINTMRPGRPQWIREEFAYLGKTSRILRDHSKAFINYQFLPLVPTSVDSVYVNAWRSSWAELLFTIYSQQPSGFNGLLFNLEDADAGNGVLTSPDQYRFVDLWNHEVVTPVKKNGKTWIPVTIDPFPNQWLETRQEGSNSCIAVYKKSLEVKLEDKFLTFSASSGDRIVLTGEDPTYQAIQDTFPTGTNRINYINCLGQDIQKIVIQLYSDNMLMDEVVLKIPDARPVLISERQPTRPSGVAPAGMVEIPGGKFRFYTKRSPSSLEPFIPLPDLKDTIEVEMKKFYMDRYPVTNGEYFNFIKQTSYNPDDRSNYLKHWINGMPETGTEDHPVVYINLDDAKSYARWAGKRLPSEQEWQYAAQGSDMRKYPWGKEWKKNRCNESLNHSTPVNSFPGGKSPFGVEDMVGNVWQLTDDVYCNGAYYYVVIRGGSYYNPTESIWYVTGGPMPTDHPEILLLISPSLDRNATVGFRCVMDAE